MEKSTRDEIIVKQLQTPRGSKLFAAALFRGFNRAFGIPDGEGEVFIQEFQDMYGISRGLPTYLRYLLETTYRPKPTVH
jgi:hypothetical protein